MTSAINDLSIYGIFYGNYPELVKVLEHAKDHVKAELKQSKERLEIVSALDQSPNTIDGSKPDPAVNHEKHQGKEDVHSHLDKRI